jgi:hypothetical protein
VLTLFTTPVIFLALEAGANAAKRAAPRAGIGGRNGSGRMNISAPFIAGRSARSC